MKHYFISAGVDDNIILNRYLNFILHFKNFPTTNNYTENHHILPRSLFPEYSNEKWNNIPLSARQHFIAHIMLWKIFKTKQMTYALWGMKNQSAPNQKRSSKLNSKMYKKLKEEISTRMRENNPMHNPEVLKKKSGANHHCHSNPNHNPPTKTKEQHENQSKRMRENNPMHNPEIAKQHSLKLKGKPKPKVECPICHKVGGTGGMGGHIKKCISRDDLK